MSRPMEMMMDELETNNLLIKMQAETLLCLVEMLMTRVDDLTEDELRYLSFIKSGSYHALGQGDS